MIAADAHTNPLTWRKCHHVYEDPIAPHRCLACGAVDHGPVSPYDPDPVVAALRFGGMGGVRVGSEPRDNVDAQALVRDSHGRLMGSIPRPDTRAECLDDQTPCKHGHVGRWMRRKDGRRQCRDCQVISAQKYRMNNHRPNAYTEALRA